MELSRYINQLLNRPVQTQTKPVDIFKQIHLVDRTEEAGCLRRCVRGGSPSPIGKVCDKRMRCHLALGRLCDPAEHFLFDWHHQSHCLRRMPHHMKLENVERSCWRTSMRCSGLVWFVEKRWRNMTLKASCGHTSPR